MAVETIDGYLARFEPRIRRRLERMRAIIRAAAPDATERISYRIPTFFLNGNLVHFAGHAHHIGFYPGAAGVAAFAAELSDHVWAKGSIKLPHDRPLPVLLVRRITKFRAAQNRAKPERKRRTNAR